MLVEQSLAIQLNADFREDFGKVLSQGLIDFQKVKVGWPHLAGVWLLVWDCVDWLALSSVFLESRLWLVDSCYPCDSWIGWFTKTCSLKQLSLMCWVDKNRFFWLLGTVVKEQSGPPPPNHVCGTFSIFMCHINIEIFSLFLCTILNLIMVLLS